MMTSQTLRPTNKARTPDRTRELLAALYTLRYATNKQLFKLLIPPDLPDSIVMSRMSRIKAITQRLSERGYLKRVWTEVTASQMNEYVHFLTPSGYDLVRETCGLGSPHDYFNSARESDGLKHDWYITEIHISLSQALASAGHKLIYWEQRRPILHIPNIEEPNPDIVTYIGSSYSYWEIERGKQGNHRNGASEQWRKVERYAHYAASGRCFERWKSYKLNMRNFFVRFVFLNDIRAEHFLMRVSRHHPDVRFMATDIPSLLRQPLGYVWKSACDYQNRAYSLLNLNPIEL